MHPGLILRLLHINLVLARHGLDEIILSLHLFRPLRFLLLLNPFVWGGRRRLPLAVRVREALEDLGPIFVKFGQMLSTRRDILPDDVATELAALQDRVPPFPGVQATALVEQALGQSVDQLFASFSTEPLASASIAQVHAATLEDGREVVVKVLRPGIERRIRRDIALMYALANLAERFWRDARRLRAREVVAEYEKTIYDELDMIREGANAALLRRNFLGSPLLYVPAVEWRLCRRNVLVMERIRGIPVSDVAQMREHGVDMKKLSERGVEIFFTQVFRHNFFHADMHPGNIFVSYEHPESPQYIGVDFGIMGSLSPRDQRYLAENFVAFFNRDYQRVAELHVESGWVEAGTRVDEFEGAIRAVCEPIFQRPLSEISFGQLLVRLFQTARRFNMEVQPQLVLLQKTLLNIEGLGRQLDPDLDLWATAKPFLDRWMSEQLGPRALLRGLRRNLPYLAEKLPDLPELGYRVLRQAAQGELEVQWRSGQLETLRRELRRSNERSIRSIVGSALLVAAFLALDAPGTGWRLSLLGLEAPLLSWLLAAAGTGLIVWGWPYQIRRG